VSATRVLPARAGVGLRATHHEEVLERLPQCGWFEAHSENYFAAGGGRANTLERVAQHYPLSLHGVGLSLGSTDPFDVEHLRALRRLVGQVAPAQLSEHLSWSSVGGRFANDLLPLPYTEEALGHMCERVAALQDYLGRQILVENVASYLQFRHSTLREWEFLAALVAESGCGLLLDINNIHVNAMNHRFDPLQFLQGIPAPAVQELHLAGHSIVPCDGQLLYIDTHAQPVAAEVWALFDIAVARFGALPTLIEWDSDIPALDVLLAEAGKADAILAEHRAVAA
jgi:uncharacterized protein (UPF0276 family)